MPGVGTLRLPGLFSRVATAEADASRWEFHKRGRFGRAVDATDVTGAPAGTFEPHSVRRGGHLRWGGRELALRPASAWRERYALADGDAELATFESKGWGRRPVKVSVEDDAALEPGLLLFAVYVVRGLGEEAGAAAAAGATTAAASGG